MNIVRVSACVLALCLGGATLGWLVLPSTSKPTPPKPDGTPEDVRHSFPLSADDVKLDRERPALAVVGDHVLLAWASQTGAAEYTIYLSRSADCGATFSVPTAFRTFDVMLFKSRMRDREVTRPSPVLPRLSTVGDRITLGWMEPGQPRAGTGERPMRFLVAHSRDGGVTFSEPVCMHGNDARKPNFTALSVGADGTTACVWLDAQRPQLGLLADRAAAATTALVYAGPEGGKGICPCCDLDVARSSSGETLVAFRNSLAGNRDIYVARAKDGSPFGAPVAVAPEHWGFDGCPHDGPSLALSGDRVHVAWMSAHSGKQQVYLADAAPADLAFTPRHLGSTSAGEQGHPRIFVAGNTLHAVWDEGLSTPPPDAPKAHQHGTPLTGSGRAIVYAHSEDGGVTFAAPRQLAPKAGAFQVRPVVAVDATGGVHVAWSELTEGGKSVVYLRPNPDKEVCCDKSTTGATANGHTR